MGNKTCFSGVFMDEKTNTLYQGAGSLTTWLFVSVLPANNQHQVVICPYVWKYPWAEIPQSCVI